MNKQIFKGYFSFIKGVSTRDLDLHVAIHSSFVDIEDGFQYYSALENCDVFLTFNKKDFSRHQRKELPCLTPSEFLEGLKF